MLVSSPHHICHQLGAYSARQSSKHGDNDAFNAVLRRAHQGCPHTLIDDPWVQNPLRCAHGGRMDQRLAVFSCVNQKAGPHRLFTVKMMDNILLYPLLQLVPKPFGNRQIIPAVHQSEGIGRRYHTQHLMRLHKMLEIIADDFHLRRGIKIQLQKFALL